MRRGILIFSLFIAIASSAMASTWARRYTEAGTSNIARSIEPTDDGGFIVGGISYTSINDETTYDIFLMKLDSSGGVQWKKTYGGNNKDYAYSIIKTSDAGFLVVGTTRSFGAGGDDVWLLKVDSTGNIQWQNTYGSTKPDYGYSAAQTPDGGFIVASATEYLSNSDYWLLKLSSSGAIQWQRIYGNFSLADLAPSIILTSDGGYMLCASSPMGNWRTVLIKLNSNGDIDWQKYYQPGGVTFSDQPLKIQQIANGGYVVLTQTWISSKVGLGFLKINSTGDVQWFKLFELNDFSFIRDFDQTSDGGYILAGMNSDSTLATWLIKLDSSGNIEWQKTYNTNGSDDIFSLKQLSSGEFILAGAIKPSGAQFSDVWILKLDSTGGVDPSCTFINDISTTPKAPTITNGDNNAEMLGPFLNSQSTSITPSSPSINIVEQCSGGCPLITVSPTNLSDGIVGIAYNQTISATGGTAPYTFAVTSGALPAGLSLNSNTGLISGTPTTVQSSTFQITATDSSGCAGSRSYTIDINATCLFCDDFEDGVQPSWLITKPDFTETVGSYVGTPAGNKAEVIASPVFPGCSVCSVEVIMRTAGGAFNKVWLVVFYIDKNNLIELLMKEESDRWVIKQRINKTVVAKAKGILTIDPNVDYAATIFYDGTTVTVTIDGSPLITMTPVGTPNGTVGFRVKNTTGSFNSIVVN
jgi:Putative Ig domain